MKLSLLSFSAAALTATLAFAIGPRDDTLKGYPLTIKAFIHCNSDCTVEGMGDLTVTQSTPNGTLIGTNIRTFESSTEDEDNKEKGGEIAAEIVFDKPTLEGEPRTVYVYHSASGIDAQCDITVAGDLQVPTVDWDFFPQVWKKEHDYAELGMKKVAADDAGRRLEIVCVPAPLGDNIPE